MNFIFGPVPSRRLGLSLGINIVPFKTCSYNCIYCEVGKTTHLSVERRRFYDPHLIESEFIGVLETAGRFDYVTFSGSGEPTLNSDLGDLIRFVKSQVECKVCVLTNGSLMFREDVRAELAAADLIIPSLDAARAVTFKRINMPHPSLDIQKIIDGIAAFSEENPDKVWLEVLFVKGVNHAKEDLDALIDAIKKIKPLKVQIGTVDRPPAYTNARRLSDSEMMDVYLYLSAHLENVELIGRFNANNRAFKDNVERSIIKIINIRPCSREELSEIFSIDPNELDEILKRLFREKKAFEVQFGSKLFIAGNRSAAGLPG